MSNFVLPPIKLRPWVNKKVFTNTDKNKGFFLVIKGSPYDEDCVDTTKRTELLNLDTQKNEMLTKIDEIGRFFNMSYADVEAMKLCFLSNRTYFAPTDLSSPSYHIYCPENRCIF